MIECMKGAGGRMYSGCFVRVEDICYGDASSQPGVNNFEKKIQKHRLFGIRSNGIPSSVPARTKPMN